MQSVFRGGVCSRNAKPLPEICCAPLANYRPSLKGRVFLCASQLFRSRPRQHLRSPHRIACMRLERVDPAAQIAHAATVIAGFPGVAVSGPRAPLWLPDLGGTQQLDFRFHRFVRFFFSPGSPSAGLRTIATLWPTLALTSAKLRALSMNRSRSLAIGVIRADSNAISRMK